MIMPNLSFFPYLIMIWKAYSGLLLILCSLVLVLIWPQHFLKAADDLGENPVKYLGVGLLFWILYIFLMILSVIASFLLIGLPFLGFLIVLGFAMKFYGFAVVYSWIGGLILRKFRSSEDSALAFVVTGGIALLALHFIPYLGIILFFLAAKIASGTAIYGVYQQRLRPSSSSRTSI
jgi:Zn-dependent protease with chaperone function